MKDFNELLGLHRELDDLFLAHQRALMRLDLDSAGTLLSQYEDELLAHIRDEETLMLPLYRERVDPPIGGTVEIFLGDHEKLRRLLTLFQEELLKIRAMDDAERGALFLLDSQYLFKRLLVHHDTREKKILYPLLNRATTEAERVNLFAKLERKATRGEAHAVTAG